uniref:Uncharacterized protein n=1 Tax=Tanacetum cinerariifolium TaxID=118510 RepID=A0A6L2JH01_TANCI|nr:hypothetical protein [Tanacetum cinerariifolium]
MKNFIDILNICPRLPRERFQDPLVEEEILSFLSDLGHYGEIRVLTDVNVNSMHQPWRSFTAIINSIMDSMKAQQMELDEALVATTNRLKIRKGNQRLSHDLKSNEATIQVVCDALKLTPVYNVFFITASVPEIYMQEFWVTVTLYHTSLRFKLNGKSHSLNMKNFIDILNICPRLPRERFQDPLVEEEILSFLSDLSLRASNTT